MADITAKTKLSKEDSGSIVSAVDEACSNIIRHSYKNDYSRKIDLTVRLKTNSLTISILDDGIHFDINSIEPRDTNHLNPGGLGIFIIKQIMDTVEYSRTSKGSNKIKMVKKLPS